MSAPVTSSSSSSSSLLSSLSSYSSYGMLGLVGILIVGGIGYYFYKSNLTPILDKLSENGKEQTVQVLLFSVDWCPHCKTAAPEWEQFQSRYNNTTSNKTKYLISSINCTEETPKIESLISKYGIEGYPTVKMVLGDNSVVDFNAKITNDNLSEFLKNF